MGAPRVTPAEIVEMHRLYAELGTYAAVGKAMGRSAGTVSKYIKMQNVPNNVRIAVQNLAQKNS